MVSSNHGAIASTSPPFPRPIDVQQVKANFNFLRNHLGYSQGELAQALDQSQTTISRWSSKRNNSVPPITKVISIAKALGVEPICLTTQHLAVEKLVRGDGDIVIDTKTMEAVIWCPTPTQLKDYKNNIRFLRIKVGISQDKLAELLHTNQGAVSLWENTGDLRMPPQDKVDDLARILGTKVNLINAPADVLASSINEALPYPSPKTINDLKANLIFYRKRSGLNQAELANQLGVSHITVGRWERTGVNQFIPDKYIHAVVRLLKADLNTLMLPDLQSDSPSENRSAPAPVVANDADRIYDEKANVAQIYLLNENDPLLNMTTSTFAAAGPEVPSDMQDDTSISEMIGMQLGNGLAAARVTGDSMYIPETGAGIPDGAIVIIDTSQRDIQSALGKVVCYRVNGCYLVKRLRKNHGKLNAVSDNPNYFPLFYSDADEVELIGLVVGMLQSIK